MFAVEPLRSDGDFGSRWRRFAIVSTISGSLSVRGMAVLTRGISVRRARRPVALERAPDGAEAGSGGGRKRAAMEKVPYGIDRYKQRTPPGRPHGRSRIA